MSREWKPGDVASRWTIIGEPQRDTRRRLKALARCQCGTVREVRLDKVGGGKSRSCGCLMRELKQAQMTRHGRARTPEYRAWQDMIQRCTNSNVEHYPHYGGRGIQVCTRWTDSFEAFFDDMGPRPEGKTLDRIDVNGHYDPANCRWATVSEQNANLRPRDACRNGHQYTPDNTRWRTKGGGRVRQCIACAAVRILSPGVEVDQ